MIKALLSQARKKELHEDQGWRYIRSWKELFLELKDDNVGLFVLYVSLIL